MKQTAIFLSAMLLTLAACGDAPDPASNDNNTGGSEQVQDPVLNSGPETEQERATDAVRDSSMRKDSNAPSTPH